MHLLPTPRTLHPQPPISRHHHITQGNDNRLTIIPHHLFRTLLFALKKTHPDTSLPSTTKDTVETDTSTYPPHTHQDNTNSQLPPTVTSPPSNNPTPPNQ